MGKSRLNWSFWVSLWYLIGQRWTKTWNLIRTLENGRRYHQLRTRRNESQVRYKEEKREETSKSEKSGEEDKNSSRFRQEKPQIALVIALLKKYCKDTYSCKAQRLNRRTQYCYSFNLKKFLIPSRSFNLSGEKFGRWVYWSSFGKHSSKRSFVEMVMVFILWCDGHRKNLGD